MLVIHRCFTESKMKIYPTEALQPFGPHDDVASSIQATFQSIYFPLKKHEALSRFTGFKDTTRR